MTKKIAKTFLLLFFLFANTLFAEDSRSGNMFDKGISDKSFFAEKKKDYSRAIDMIANGQALGDVLEKERKSGARVAKSKVVAMSMGVKVDDVEHAKEHLAEFLDLVKKHRIQPKKLYQYADSFDYDLSVNEPIFVLSMLGMTPAFNEAMPTHNVTQSPAYLIETADGSVHLLEGFDSIKKYINGSGSFTPPAKRFVVGGESQKKDARNFNF